MLEPILLLGGATIAALGYPGPVPLALAATGASFGPRAGLQFLLGILTGLAGVAILSAAGIAPLLTNGGWIAITLLAVSMSYFVYIAFKIAAAPFIPEAPNAIHNPPSFRDGFMLNLTNPKAYVAFAALYAGFGIRIEPIWLGIGITGALILIFAALIDMAWLLMGSALAPVLARPPFGRILRITLAVLMLVTIILSVAVADISRRLE